MARTIERDRAQIRICTLRIAHYRGEKDAIDASMENWVASYLSWRKGCCAPGKRHTRRVYGPMQRYEMEVRSTAISREGIRSREEEREHLSSEE